nr:antitoxin MazE-like protein [Thiocystis violascens]
MSGKSAASEPEAVRGSSASPRTSSASPRTSSASPRTSSASPRTASGGPDTRRPGFALECRRQSGLAAKADLADANLLDFMDDALNDVDGWTP